MKVIWHIGAHKTGTTSFQKGLEVNADALSDAILPVPLNAPILQPFRAALRRAKRSTSARTLRTIEAEARRFRAALAAVAGDRTVIVSHEGTIGRIPRDAADPYPQAAARLGAIARAFADDDLTFALTTRAPDRWTDSLERHRARTRGQTARTAQEPVDWDAIVAAVESVGVHVEVLPMEADLATSFGPGHGILALAGLSEDRIAALTPPPHMNSGLNDAAMARVSHPLLRFLPPALRRFALRGPLVSVAALALISCAPATQEELTKGAARAAIKPVLAQRFPGVPLDPALDCLIENATGPELLSLAADALTGPTANTTQIASDILSRPATRTCLARDYTALVLAGAL